MSQAAARQVIVIAQGRMGSSRLPAKVLLPAGGQTLLWHLVRRLRRCQTPTKLVLATTTAASDTVLMEAATDLGLAVHRGPVDDVLARYIGALEGVGAVNRDLVVRVTADCPLLDPQELDRLVGEFLRREDTPEAVDYLTNQAGMDRTIPFGLDVEVFTCGALRAADTQSTAPGDREHVTPWLYREGGGEFRKATCAPDIRDLSYLRLTVDEPADLAVVDAVFCALGPDATTAAVAQWLDAHPEVLARNADIVHRSVASEAETRRQNIGGGLLLARADAGGTIGFGHVARVTALADAWLELGGAATVVGQGITGGARQRLLDLGATVVDGADGAFESHAADARVLVVDGYTFGLQLHTRWAKLGRPLVAIDDLASFPPQAAVVVNQNLNFDAGRYGATDARLLVGNSYVLLRREFRRFEPGPPGAPTVLMTFGGSDPAALSVPMAQATLQATDGEVQIDLVVGPGVAADAQAQLSKLAATEPRLRLHRDVTDMTPLMRAATMAVTAAGGTVWELMACGVPIALMAVADNQRLVVAGAAARGAILDLGWHEDLEPRQAAEAIRDLLDDSAERKRLKRQAAGLIDGRGVVRVIDAALSAERTVAQPEEA